MRPAGVLVALAALGVAYSPLASAASVVALLSTTVIVLVGVVILGFAWPTLDGARRRLLG